MYGACNWRACHLISFCMCTMRTKLILMHAEGSLSANTDSALAGKPQAYHLTGHESGWKWPLLIAISEAGPSSFPSRKHHAELAAIISLVSWVIKGKVSCLGHYSAGQIGFQITGGVLRQHCWAISLFSPVTETQTETRNLFIVDWLSSASERGSDFASAGAHWGLSIYSWCSEAGTLSEPRALQPPESINALKCTHAAVILAIFIRQCTLCKRVNILCNTYFKNVSPAKSLRVFFVLFFFTMLPASSSESDINYLMLLFLVLISQWYD